MFCDSSILDTDQAASITHIETKDRQWNIYDCPLLESFTLLYDNTVHIHDAAKVMILSCPRVHINWVSIDRCVLPETKHVSICTTTFFGDCSSELYTLLQKLMYEKDIQRVLQTPNLETLEIIINQRSEIETEHRILCTCITNFDYPNLQYVSLHHVLLKDSLCLPSIKKRTFNHCVFTRQAFSSIIHKETSCSQCFLISDKRLLHITFTDDHFMHHKIRFACTLASMDPSFAPYTVDDFAYPDVARMAYMNPCHY